METWCAVCSVWEPTTITSDINVRLPCCSFLTVSMTRIFLLLFRILNDFLSTHVPRAWRFNGCSRTHLNLSVDIGNYFADPQWLIVASWTRVLPAKCSRDFATLISPTPIPAVPVLWSISIYSLNHPSAKKQTGTLWYEILKPRRQ